jgi:hypothetical protein
MGIDIADYRNAGVPAVAVANFSEEPVSLYVWQKDGTFLSQASVAGIALPTYPDLAFGIRFLDMDLDGVQDLVIANGHIEPDVSRVFQHLGYAQSPQLFHGSAYGQYEDVSTRAGPDFMVPRVARGLAAGDLDGDGDLDLILTIREGVPVVFQNRRGPRDACHYLRVRLEGQGKNTKALGSYVRLQVAGTTQTQLARTGSSYLSESEMTLTFGLGTATKVDGLVVRWPGGRETAVTVEGVDRTVVVREPGS